MARRSLGGEGTRRCTSCLLSGVKPGHDERRGCTRHDPADGYSDVPAGKIAAVVTHLEMTARPAIAVDPLGAWSLRKVERPDLAWYRDLYRRVGEEWLWFSRIRASDEKLAARLHHPLVET